jgi:pimeloyl-ACP methyl ester carboxylesterase
MKYTTAMFAADAAAILDELGAEQAIVCGHSNGGRVVQSLALDYPRKVSKLILASSGSSFSETKGLPLKLCQGMIEKDLKDTFASTRSKPALCPLMLRRIETSSTNFSKSGWRESPLCPVTYATS